MDESIPDPIQQFKLSMNLEPTIRATYLTTLTCLGSTNDNRFIYWFDVGVITLRSMGIDRLLILHGDLYFEWCVIQV